MAYVYEVTQSGRGEFHRWDVVRRWHESASGIVVVSYKYQRLADDMRAILEQAEEMDNE